MEVRIQIDPGCEGVSVTITAGALTDEVKALARRLEGGETLLGWRDGEAFPLPAEELLRCYGEDKGGQGPDRPRRVRPEGAALRAGGAA